MRDPNLVSVLTNLTYWLVLRRRDAKKLALILVTAGLASGISPHVALLAKIRSEQEVLSNKDRYRELYDVVFSGQTKPARGLVQFEMILRYTLTTGGPDIQYDIVKYDDGRFLVRSMKCSRGALSYLDLEYPLGAITESEFEKAKETAKTIPVETNEFELPTDIARELTDSFDNLSFSQLADSNSVYFDGTHYDLWIVASEKTSYSVNGEPLGAQRISRPVVNWMNLAHKLLSRETRSPVAQARYWYGVRGRVVDARGHAVRGAFITVVPESPVAEHLSSYVESDATGNFVFRNDQVSNLKARNRLLYVTGPLPRGAVTVFLAPFTASIRRLGGVYSGSRILVKRNAEVDLGDVPLKIGYGVIKLALKDWNNHALVTDLAEWKNVWLRIRSSKTRRIVAERSLSLNDLETAVDAAHSTCAVALPEGEWFVNISLNENKGPWLGSDNPVKVSASAGPLNVIIRSGESSARIRRPR
jgi:hypothetical protein